MGMLCAVSYLLLLASLAIAAGRPDTNGSGRHDHSQHADQTYDFIVGGGGTSGLVVANRLTEDPNISVLVIEYGYLDNNFSVLVPYNANFNNYRDLYNITSTPLVHLNNKPYPVIAAATVGGGSVVNGMFFDRASALDYDAWEELGNPGWGWKGLLPYFIKSTNFTPPTPEVARRYNYTWDAATWGTDGPVHASLPPFQWPCLENFVDGFGDLGNRGIEYPRDGSDGSGVGVFWVPTSQDPDTQTRSDARTAYYDPVRGRRNLHLLTATKVDKVLFENKTAVGVQMTSRDTNITSAAYVRKEVILCAGPIFSSNVLHLSGIGPRSMLEEAGIEVIHDLPGVGLNFQDHPTAYLSWNLTNAPYPNPETLMTNETFSELAKEEYFANRAGPYIQSRGNNAAFLSLRTIAPELISTVLATLSSKNTTTYLPPHYPPSARVGYAAQHRILTRHLASPDAAMYELPFKGDPSGVANSLQKPLSRGTITLNTTHPFTAPPVVDYGTFSNPVDGLLAVAMINFTRRYFRSPTLESFGPVEIIPGANLTTTAQILQALTVGGLLTPSFAHSSCSNAMMPEHMGGVVTPSLEVYGTRGLSVVDASVMPMIPATHLCATVYAVAEKGVDLIKQRHGCK